MILKVLLVASLALIAGALAENVRADEIFLCEDGRQLHIASNEVDQAKQTDPCVAAHFGLPMPKAPSIAQTRTTVEPPLPNPRRTGLRRTVSDLQNGGSSTHRVDLSNVVILNASTN